MGEGLFLASHEAQRCQNPRLTVTNRKQVVEELYSSPEHTREEEVVVITLRNKTEKQLKRQTLSSLPSITRGDDTEIQTEELITRLTQLHLMWPLLSVDKERTMRFLLS